VEALELWVPASRINKRQNAKIVIIGLIIIIINIFV